MNREIEAVSGSERRSAKAVFAGLLALALSTGLLGCEPEDDGGLCDSCSIDAECDSGRTCLLFDDGYGHCADDENTKCAPFE